MNIFKKKSYFSVNGTEEKKKTEKNKKSQEPSIPDGMWIKCNTCKNIIYKKEVTEFKLCPNCGAHFRMNPSERIKIICDEGSFRELDANMSTENPMNYPDYDKVIGKAKAKSGINEAVVTGECTVGGFKTVIAIMDSHFMMGSMGSVVGEKITRAIEYSTEKRLPIIIFTTSGGARMQEGIVSLMQMAKTAEAGQAQRKADGSATTGATRPHERPAIASTIPKPSTD